MRTSQALNRVRSRSCVEAPIRLGEGFLCDVFSIFPLPEDAERHTERQPRGVRQASLELTLELPVGRHEAARKAFGVLMHQASPRPDAGRYTTVHCRERQCSSRFHVHGSGFVFPVSVRGSEFQVGNEPWPRTVNPEPRT